MKSSLIGSPQCAFAKSVRRSYFGETTSFVPGPGKYNWLNLIINLLFRNINTENDSFSFIYFLFWLKEASWATFWDYPPEFSLFSCQFQMFLFFCILLQLFLRFFRIRIAFWGKDPFPKFIRSLYYYSLSSFLHVLETDWWQYHSFYLVQRAVSTDSFYLAFFNLSQCPVDLMLACLI